MDKSGEALKTLASTLEKYKKNRTMVAPEDLKGKYKVPFQNLKKQLESDLQEYIRTYCFADIDVLERDSSELASEFESIYQNINMAKRIGAAAFEKFNLKEVQEVTQDYRRRVKAVYDSYLEKHTALFITTACVEAERPERPRIYNDVLGKFYDEATNKWRDPAPGEKNEEAVLLFVNAKGSSRL